MINRCDALALMDPMRLLKWLWPDSAFYDQQRQMVLSVRDSKETYVAAGNQLGKDYTAGAIALGFFLRPQAFFPLGYVRQVEAAKTARNPHPHTVRVVTTSVAEHHLKVLWGEIARFVVQCRFPLMWHPDDNPGGVLTMNYQEVRYAWERSAKNPMSYLAGRVSAKGEGLAGHHAAYTLCVMDEASGIDDVVYRMQQGWAKRLLAFGNPNSCENFWRKGIEAGDLKVED